MMERFDPDKPSDQGQIIMSLQERLHDSPNLRNSRHALFLYEYVG
jgi:hypothetical protein